MSVLRKLTLVGLLAGCACLGGLVAGDTPALAVLQYPLVGEIGTTAVPSGGFEYTDFAAVDGADVLAGGERKLYSFGPSDELEWSSFPVISAMAVNEGTGDIYVGSVAEGGGGGNLVGVIDVYDSAGNFLTQITATGGGKPVPGGLTNDIRSIAVDQATGEIYVFDSGNAVHVIDVFSAAGEYLFQITSAGANKLAEIVDGMAVDDANGELLVGDGRSKGGSLVDVFDAATGAYITTWNGSNTPQKAFVGSYAVPAVDNATGEVFVATDGELSESKTVTPAVIDRFTAIGEYENQITGTPEEAAFAAETLKDVAVSHTGDRVYVLESARPVYERRFQIFAANPVAVPRLRLETPSNVKPTSLTLRGTVNPEETGEATCEFEYGTTLAYGQRAPCTAAIANGNATVPVQATVSGLKSGTTYYFRLVGRDVADGYTNPGEHGEAASQVTMPGPEVLGEGVASISGEGASFEAKLVPNGVSTSAYFEYGTSEAYGASSPAPPGAHLGAGTTGVELTRHVQGLLPGTVYHYRLVMLSELEPGKVETVEGPDRTFITQPVAAPFGLPDGRAWELVTPAEKHGALFYAQNYAHLAGAQVWPFVAEASVRGDAMINLASAPTEAQPQGNGAEAPVLSTRSSTGWSSRVIALPHEHGTGIALGEGSEYRFFSEDLSHAVVEQFGSFLPLSPEASESTPYVRTNYVNGDVNEPCKSSCYRPVVTAADTRSGAVFGGETEPGIGCKFVCGPELIDATPDASHVVISTSVQLTEAGIEAGPPGFLYEWGGGQLQPLFLLPAGEGGIGVGPERGTYGLSVPAHQLADDGSVFFTHHEHLYLHDFARGVSVRLDVARGVSEPSVGNAKFLYAASDGSRVLFSDAKHLTGAGRGGIYECRIVEGGGGPSCELSLTPLAGGTLLNGSRDASYLYFENAGEQLVVDHYEGGVWTTTAGPYIGALPAGDGQDELEGFGGGGPGDSSAVPETETSSNGRYLTFMSGQELTGYDNRDAVSGQPDVEVYLYDAVANKLVCASCNPTGARPVGVEYNETDLVAGSLYSGWVASNLPPWTRVAASNRSLYETRFLSDSGRLFFDSRDALVPQDVNGQQDVYEYEPPGVGDCTLTSAAYGNRSGGCVRLVSAGSSAEESAFMDASEGGGDVFFITLSKLTSQDFDSALDVYDAHECTPASPCAAQPVAPPPCSTGDGCKPAPTPQPSIFGEPASATFSGSGNVPVGGSAPAPGRSAPRLSGDARKLAGALVACRKKHGKRRLACERAARKRYVKVASRRVAVPHGKRG